MTESGLSLSLFSFEDGISMKIDGAYHFLFHPISQDHPTWVKVTSVFTAIVLSFLSCGAYLLFFVTIRLREHFWSTHTVAPSLQTSQDQLPPLVDAKALLPPRLAHIKTEQAKTLALLKQYGSCLAWEKIGTSLSHFDWWMFPIDRPSDGYGTVYQVKASEVCLLKKDPQFLTCYREGISLVLDAWKNGSPFYPIRFGKMVDSARLFGQLDLHADLVSFIQKRGIKLPDWILPLLKSS